MASTNWNNITNTVLKGTIALSLITISGCVVPVTYKAYQVLNDVQNVTKDVRYAAKTMGNRVSQVSSDDIDGIMKSVRELLDSLNNATKETIPTIKDTILSFLTKENIGKILDAVKKGKYVDRILTFIDNYPGIIRRIEKCVDVKPEQPSLQKSVSTTASDNSFSEKTESDSDHKIQEPDENAETESYFMMVIGYLLSWCNS